MKKLFAMLAVMMLILSAAALSDAIPGVEDGVLTVAMECAYAPYNWAQPDDSNGAVPIKDSMLYANGYDVMMAKAICEANGWQLEIVQLEWDSLIPAVQSGVVDAVIAGQSMTAERMEAVDFAGPYLYASIVCLVREDNPNAQAGGISALKGTATSQSGTIWYDTCLPQLKNVTILPPAESAPAMLMAVASGTVDMVCTDMPTAQGALIAYPNLKILDFAGTGDDFTVSDEDINIGISVMKGNTALLDAINGFLADKTADDFNAMMAEAIRIQPLSE
ncbi:MAG: transporter substrate-binding domain-containing protein [Clostridia bacterium]|nr:transporter substrate-binding domain-containing protein [Clostridia bacterium]